MKKFFAILAFVGIVATGVAQEVTKPGIYDKNGNLIEAEVNSVVANVTLYVSVEQFTPGKYARYAQKHLGAEVTCTASTTAKLLGAQLALGKAQKVAPKAELPSEALPLPTNVMSVGLSENEQAAATAKLIFSLRQHRLELITGEAGENVFGAGLKAALDEIARMEKEYLEMFYGKTTVTEKVYTFNIALTPEKSEYAVCRFSDKKGVVEADDLSAMPIVLKVETTNRKENTETAEGATKVVLPKGAYIIPQSKCLLIGEATLLDSIEFASPIYADKVVAAVAK